MKSETKPWWRQAEADLETARINLQADRYYAASWFCQQTAEKALKALYLERSATEAPRIHDLESLGEEVDVPAEVDADLSLINPVFSRVRYPELTGGGLAPVDTVDRHEAADHLQAAERVLTWVEQQLASSP